MGFGSTIGFREMGGQTYDNQGLRFKGGPRTASKKLAHIKRAAACRYVMAGYPIETGFTSPEDVWAYLNADRITCLRCGKPYKVLGVHLSIHGWNAQRYKEFYGLPWRTGLTSSMTKAVKRRLGKESFEAGIAFGGNPGLGWDKAYVASRRKRAPYLAAVAVRNLSKAPAHDRQRIIAGDLCIWRDADYWSVLDRMTNQDRSVADVCGDADMPGTSALGIFARSHPKYAEALDAVWEGLSFPVQAKAERLGKRFKKEASALRKKGLTAEEIGEELGVHRVTVERYIAGVPCPEKTHCPKGHPYPHDGPKSCRICNTEQARVRRGHLSRSEAAKTPIKVFCFRCGKPVVRSRLWGRKRKSQCHDCFLAYQREYDRTTRRVSI